MKYEVVGFESISRLGGSKYLVSCIFVIVYLSIYSGSIRMYPYTEVSLLYWITLFVKMGPSITDLWNMENACWNLTA